jgi:hypothetical protein
MGVTELIGKDDQVDQNEYSESIALTFDRPTSGELLQFTFYTWEDGSGAIQDPAGTLIILDADPANTIAGVSQISKAEHLTIIGQVAVEADDWITDATGGSACVTDTPIAFHDVTALYFLWFHTDATSFNDAAGDNEYLEMNAWYRKES